MTTGPIEQASEARDSISAISAVTLIAIVSSAVAMSGDMSFVESALMGFGTFFALGTAMIAAYVFFESGDGSDRAANMNSISYWRSRRHMTIESLGVASNIRPSRIDDMETGRRLATEEEIAVLAEILGVTPDDVRRP